MAAIAALLLVALAGGASAAVKASAISKIVALLVKAGLSARAGQIAATVVVTRPVLAAPRRIATAVDVVAQQDAMYRAAFAVNSAKRAQVALSRGSSPAEVQAMERRFFLQHMQARAQRMVAAKNVDKMAKKHGNLVGWYTVIDGKTSPECKAANGTNFEADDRPAIGYPGAVHPECRCYAGKPHPGGKSTDAATTRYFRKAA